MSSVWFLSVLLLSSKSIRKLMPKFSTFQTSYREVGACVIDGHLNRKSEGLIARMSFWVNANYMTGHVHMKL